MNNNNLILRFASTKQKIYGTCMFLNLIPVIISFIILSGDDRMISVGYLFFFIIYAVLYGIYLWIYFSLKKVINNNYHYTSLLPLVVFLLIICFIWGVKIFYEDFWTLFFSLFFNIIAYYFIIKGIEFIKAPNE